MADRSLRVWDLKSGVCQRILEGHTDEVNSLTISPDGLRIISGGKDKSIRVWDLKKGDCLRTLEGHTKPVRTLAISPQGHRLISGGSDSSIFVWTLNWDYVFPEPVDWDEGVRPYLEIFLTLHTPVGLDGLSRYGKPIWNEDDFQRLLVELGYRGYGYLRQDGVQRKLEEMAAARGQNG